MKTVRFAHVVAKGGKPEVHLLLTNPKFDHVLQKAAKSGRVMTIHQASVGSKADFGSVGFLEGVTGQVLIFPKSIKSFAGRNVVGIHYELLAEEPPNNPKVRPAVRVKKRHATPRLPRVIKKLVEFPSPEPDSQNDALGKLKATARLALKALADGKQVLAFHLLEKALKT